MLVPGEAPSEGEGNLRLRRPPVRMVHAVAPGVEVGVLFSSLVWIHFDCGA